jgi:hypothetical protein
MKSRFVAGLLGLALAFPVLGQDLTYENPGFFAAPPEIPPNIDALNFVNDGQFIINFTNTVWLLPPYQPPPPYEMQNVQNYTNSFGAFLSCNTGLRLQTYDPTLQVRKTASSFWNDGTINIGTISFLRAREGFWASLSPVRWLPGSICTQPTSPATATLTWASKAFARWQATASTWTMAGLAWKPTE